MPMCDFRRNKRHSGRTKSALCLRQRHEKTVLRSFVPGPGFSSLPRASADSCIYQGVMPCTVPFPFLLIGCRHPDLWFCAVGSAALLAGWLASRLCSFFHWEFTCSATLLLIPCTRNPPPCLWQHAPLR